MEICLNNKSKKLIKFIEGHLYEKEKGIVHLATKGNNLVNIRDGIPFNTGNGFGKSKNAVEYWGWKDVTDKYCLIEK